MEKNFHLARTLTRVERRTQVAKMGRAWRAWGEVVRTEAEAELQAMERHYHVAQTVSRVLARVRERRLLRAWGLWARLAARGGNAGGRPNASRRASGSLSSFPPGILAAARSSHHAPSLERAGRTDASPPGASASGTATSSSHPVAVPADQLQLQQQARQSRAVRHRAGAGAVWRLLKGAGVRQLSRSWRAWREATTADAAREARAILGATRIAELFDEVRANHDARVLRRWWARWAEISASEGRRLDQKAEAESWAIAETESKRAKAATAAGALVAPTGRSDDRLLRVSPGAQARASQISRKDGEGGGGNRWSPGTARNRPISVAEEAKTPHDGARRGGSVGGLTPSSASPTSAVRELRRRLRGESPAGLSVRPSASAETGKSSPDSTVRPPHHSTLPASPPLPHAPALGTASPVSPLLPQRSSSVKRESKPGGGPTPPSSGRAWSDLFNYSSSSPGSPFGPLAAAAVSGGVEEATAVPASGIALPETRSPFADDGDGDELDDYQSCGSLDLTASGESVGVFRSHSAGAAASLPLVVATAGVAGGSPEGNPAAYMSDSSPLLGERVLLLRDAGAGGGGRTLALGSNADATDGGVAAGSLPSDVPARHDPSEATGSPADRGGVSNSGTPRATTPNSSRLSRQSVGSPRGSGSESRRSATARFPKSPPYVGGSVGALRSRRGSPPWEPEGSRVRAEERRAYSSPYGGRRDEEDVEDEEEVLGVGVEGGEVVASPAEEEPMYQLHGRRPAQHNQGGGGGYARVGLRFPAFGGEMARAAEDFVDIMMTVLWRRAFGRWARLSRDAAFNQKAKEGREKVGRALHNVHQIQLGKFLA